ncbi:MAG: hypothetical protein WDN03_17965 [Rhizomicrobium sp.]
MPPPELPAALLAAVFPPPALPAELLAPPEIFRTNELGPVKSVVLDPQTVVAKLSLSVMSEVTKISPKRSPGVGLKPGICPAKTGWLGVDCRMPPGSTSDVEQAPSADAAAMTSNILLIEEIIPWPPPLRVVIFLWRNRRAS